MSWNTLVVFCLGFLGGVAGQKTRIPGGVLIGAMLFAASANFVGMPPASLPPFYNLSLQIMAGCLVGIGITTKTLKDLKKIVAPVLLNALIILTGGIVVAVVISHLFFWGRITSWLASSPGRMQDMVIFSDSLGADTTKVAGVHIMRTISVVILTPLILKGHDRLRKQKNLPSQNDGEKKKGGH
ncbi:AbrB family transcriptional regulator [Candidatus Formimonas warabiya]|uniref:AbrB family transcriptional regulator n=1 Tax=Formimonas warabiya TaxID=1761012 RepID=A0A3G1KYB4_FORW1|nr:AbrB family transcriptional regulator [Candidatus Formimonas warabiya]ATW27400.1 hypothetical protein DCMF_23965 [Candidatus Formimonas warabiya]